VVSAAAVFHLLSRYVMQWMGEKRGLYRVLVEKPEGKRPLGRPRPR